MPELTIHNLTASYDSQSKILDSLDLSIQESEIVAVMGKSGSGKTTLLLSILGFIVPEAGDMLLGGQRINALPIEQRLIAYVPQDYGLFPHLTVTQNIAFGLAVRGIDAATRDAKTEELLKLVGLPDGVADRNVQNLSGGERQRVALARALAIQPKLFLLDEPLSAIDIETKQSIGHELKALIKKLRLPAIIITHDPEDAKTLGDTLYALRDGKLQRM
ncbi:MAG: ABC transporter ATP-binding protein [Candidatus Harrisonbacteria bacterium]|nr:ABC transporter ATP-binding protein [Candidatus Harrisonbacteria bacterium]MBI2604157.1 ABC transporter ATP-binding protein [Candidatus Harrisonbacteria bacterium]